MNSKSKTEHKQKHTKRSESPGGGDPENAYLPIFQRRPSGSLNRDVQDSLGESNSQIYESFKETIDYGVPALFIEGDRIFSRRDSQGELPDSRLIIEKYQLLLELEYPNKPMHGTIEEKWEAVMQVKREKCKRTPEHHFKNLSSINSAFPKKSKKQENRKLEARCLKASIELKSDMIKGHISYVNDLQKVGVFYQLKVLLQRYCQLPKCAPEPIICTLICVKNALYRSEKTRNKMITFEISDELVSLFYKRKDVSLRPYIFECISLIASWSTGASQLIRFLILSTKESIVKVSIESKVRCEDGIVPFIVWYLMSSPSLSDLHSLKVKVQIVSGFYNLLANCLTLDQRVFVLEHFKVYGYEFEALDKCLENLETTAEHDYELKYYLTRLDELIGKVKVQHIDVQQTADRALRAEARNEVLRDEINQLEKKLTLKDRKLDWAMDELGNAKLNRMSDSSTNLNADGKKSAIKRPPASEVQATCGSDTVAMPTGRVQEMSERGAPPPPPPPPPPPGQLNINHSLHEDPVYVYYESVYEKLKVDYNGKMSGEVNLPTCHWEPLYAIEGTLFESAKQEEALKDLNLNEFQQKFSHAFAPSKPKTYAPTSKINSPKSGPTLPEKLSAKKVNSSESEQKQNLLNEKTAQNLIISKRRLHADDAEICDAIESINTKIVSGEMADILYKFLPSSRSELKLVAKNRSRLHQLNEADQFYVRLACIERVPNKLQVISFIDSFEERCTDCRAKIASLTDACIRSLECKDTLQKILTYFLVLGNYMNSGRKKYAPGFRLTSLESVAKISDVTGRSTVLDFVKQTVRNQMKQEKIKLLVDRVCFEPPKVSLPSLSLEIEQLEKGLNQLKEECASNELLTTKLKSKLELANMEIPALVGKQQAAYNLYHQLCGLLGEDAAVTEPDKLFSTLTQFVQKILPNSEQ